MNLRLILLPAVGLLVLILPSRAVAARNSADLQPSTKRQASLAIAEGFRISDLELNDAKKKLESASDRLKRLRDERSAALAKKKELDDAHEKTLSTEAEIARLEEELARLKGDDGIKKIETQPTSTAPAVKPGG